MSQTQFTRVQPQDLESLLTILKKRIPKSGLVYNVVQLLQMKKFSSKVRTEVHALGWNSSHLDLAAENANVVIVILQSIEYFRSKVVLLSMPEIAHEDILLALEDFIDWTRPHVFGDIEPHFSPFLAELFKRKSKTNDSIQIDTFNLLYFDPFVSWPPDSSNRTGRDVCLRTLEKSHADIVDKAWKDSSDGTLAMFVDSIETIASSGVFLENELISWAVTTPVGSINAVNTKEAFRRRGFAELAMKTIVRENYKNGLISIVHVEPLNTPSLNLMRKVNFLYSHDINWLFYSAMKI